MLDTLWQLMLGAWSLVLSWLHIARREEVKDMKAAIEKAHGRADDAHKALDAHRLYAAENFARRTEVKEAMAETERRLKEALGGVEERLTASHEKLADKLDDLAERLPPAQH